MSRRQGSFSGTAEGLLRNLLRLRQCYSLGMIIKLIVPHFIHEGLMLAIKRPSTSNRSQDDHDINSPGAHDPKISFRLLHKLTDFQHFYVKLYHLVVHARVAVEKITWVIVRGRHAKETSIKCSVQI